MRASMSAKALARRLLQSIPPFRRWIDGLNRENGALRDEVNAHRQKLQLTTAEIDRIQREIGTEKLFAPPGHFYSPIPALRDVKVSADAIFDVPPAIRGVHLHHERQLDLLRRFV